MWVRPVTAATVWMALFLVGAAVGSVYGAELQAPVLITSAGQSPGALMVHVLAERAGIVNVFDALAEPSALDGVASFIIVIGASLKGLGAVGSDEARELLRVESLLARAQELRIPIVAMHVEGAPRRGGASDRLARLVFPHAGYAIVRADGDADHFFTVLAAQYGTPLWRITATVEAEDVLRYLYGP